LCHASGTAPIFGVLDDAKRFGRESASWSVGAAELATITAAVFVYLQFPFAAASSPPEFLGCPFTWSRSPAFLDPTPHPNFKRDDATELLKSLPE